MELETIVKFSIHIATVQPPSEMQSEFSNLIWIIFFFF